MPTRAGVTFTLSRSQRGRHGSGSSVEVQVRGERFEILELYAEARGRDAVGAARDPRRRLVARERGRGGPGAARPRTDPRLRSVVAGGRPERFFGPVVAGRFLLRGRGPRARCRRPAPRGGPADPRSAQEAAGRLRRQQADHRCGGRLRDRAGRTFDRTHRPSIH